MQHEKSPGRSLRRSNVFLKQHTVGRSLPRGAVHVTCFQKPNYLNNLECIETGRNNLSQVTYSFHFVFKKNNLSWLSQPLASVQLSHIPRSHDLLSDPARSGSSTVRPRPHLRLTGLVILRPAYLSFFFFSSFCLCRLLQCLQVWINSRYVIGL